MVPDFFILEKAERFDEALEIGFSKIFFQRTHSAGNNFQLFVGTVRQDFRNFPFKGSLGLFQAIAEKIIYRNTKSIRDAYNGGEP